MLSALPYSSVSKFLVILKTNRSLDEDKVAIVFAFRLWDYLVMTRAFCYASIGVLYRQVDPQSLLVR